MKRTSVLKDKWVSNPDWNPDITYVHCPGCDVKLRLDHEIDGEGNVSPSLLCPLDGCDFHAYVKLEGWKQ